MKNYFQNLLFKRVKPYSGIYFSVNNAIILNSKSNNTAYLCNF